MSESEKLGGPARENTGGLPSIALNITGNRERRVFDMKGAFASEHSVASSTLG
jgi:hypothetical protein